MYVGYSESGGEYWSAPTGLRVAAAGLLRPAQSFTYLSVPNVIFLQAPESSG